jgi:hypothetical protein
VLFLYTYYILNYELYAIHKFNKNLYGRKEWVIIIVYLESPYWMKGKNRETI